jgi:predicted HTH transcriptional regulator
MHESQNTEFKSSWHDDYLKWICGFANAIGGMIYIGKNDKGKAVGLPDYAKLMEDLPNKIINACREAGIPDPEMVEINGGVSITLFAYPLLSEADKTSENKRGEKLSGNRQKILNAMRENPGVSQAELVEIVGIVSTNIEKNIKYLKDNGWIRRIGPAKGGYWEVTID